MQPRFGIRTKLLLSILAILLVSYSTLLYSTMNTLSASLRSEMDKNLEANLKFARSQYFDRSDIVRAFLEGVTYEIRWNLDILASTDLPVTELRAVGGGTRLEQRRGVGPRDGGGLGHGLTARSAGG